jgi:lipopolysaccharide biosynthesis glycosyltransferase
MLNDEFVIGFKSMMNSLKRYNPWFNLPLVILDDGLSEESIETVKFIYGKVHFHTIRKESYKKVNFNVTNKRLRCTYYKLDFFNISGYDRLVFIDSDVIVLGNIKELFDCSAGFAAVKGYDPRRDILRRDFNSGVFVVNKMYLTAQVYTELLKICQKGFKMPDQKTMNIFFGGRTTFLDKVYNVEKRMLYTSNLKHYLNNARILHYVGEKPWNKKTNIIEEQFSVLERKWWDYQNG